MTRCVVIPCRDEESSVGSLVNAALEHADAVVVVNDQSQDRTREAAAGAGATVVDTPSNRPGLSAVYSQGLQSALDQGFDLIAEMDAGNSHDPARLEALFAALDSADIAFGSRFLRSGDHQGHWKRKALSSAGTLAVNLACPDLWVSDGVPWTDATSGHIAYRASALATLLQTPWRAKGHFYQTEVRLRARRLGLRCVEIPITYRSTGSSLNAASIREAVRMVASL